MPHDHTVHLKVRAQPSNGSDGYTNTTATNSAIYSYKYTGGDDDHGDIRETVGSGAATIDVDLDGGSRYQIGEITFGNNNGQLSWSGGGNTAAIIDANTLVENATYATKVTDSTANCSFVCDPMIGNVPPPPQAQ